MASISPDLQRVPHALSSLRALRITLALIDVAGCGADENAALERDEARSMFADAVTRPDFFATARIAGPIATAPTSDGDLWPSCWSDDDHVYSAWGDGRGFDAARGERIDIGVSRISGSPREGWLTGINLAVGDAVGQVWSGAAYNASPPGCCASRATSISRCRISRSTSTTRRRRPSRARATRDAPGIGTPPARCSTATS